MRARRGRNRRLALAGVFVALVFVGGLAVAFNSNSGGGDGILPPAPAPEPSPRPAAPLQEPVGEAPSHGQVEHEPGAEPVPGAASLAGPPARVVRRFAHDWANRNTILTPKVKREMVGLSAGGWANAIARQARLTLPAVEGVRAEGDLVMMKLSAVAPGSKTALVVTREGLVSEEGEIAPPRYELYLARLDRVSPRGYAITAWEPQR